MNHEIISRCEFIQRRYEFSKQPEHININDIIQELVQGTVKQDLAV